jgi:hypothetical protein
MLKRLIVLVAFPLHPFRFNRDSYRYVCHHIKYIFKLVKIGYMLKHIPKTSEIIPITSYASYGDREYVVSINEDVFRSVGLEKSTPGSKVQDSFWI